MPPSPLDMAINNNLGVATAAPTQPTLAQTVQQGIIPQLGSPSPLQGPSLNIAAMLANGVDPSTAQALSGTGQQFVSGGPSAMSAEAAASLRPFMQQDLGSSPATQAAIAAFQQNTLPLIQNQLALQGLAGGSAVADVAGRSLATALPSIIQNDLSNRLAATQQFAGLEQLNQGRVGLGGNLLSTLEQLNQAGRTAGLGGFQNQQQINQRGLESAGQLAQAEENLNQSAAALQAQISDQEAQRQLAAQQASMQSLLGFGSQILSPAAQLDQAQLQTGLEAFDSGGALQRQPTQEQLANQQLDFLRQQGLAEQGSFGVFGGSVIPPVVQQSGKSTTTQSGGK